MRVFLIWLSCLSYLSLVAQQSYFQQTVDYRITVTLDDSTHTLKGEISMDYTNNSPDALSFIYFHLWGNAYQNNTTAFAQQQVRLNRTRFYFAREDQLGGFNDLNFTIDGQAAAFSLDENNPDIGTLQLNQPLPSGATITIHTPFELKIPASFSRLGHVGQSYQLTQWYPKPAVYDQDGWHPMPYLDMGEFYSEFGNFEVTITLPDNYIVGATGTLTTVSEQAFLAEKVKTTNLYLEQLPEDFVGGRADFPKSSSTLKTLRYTAERVHDFAWFADKRFMVQKSQVELSSGQEVDTWVMFTEREAELWKNAIKYVDRAVLYYSELVGEYPYPQATALQSALSAGGGMEYPMITVIGLSGTAQALDEVITHEVGHNWFYGILGSNERDYAWMDEGLNSYYDHRYSEKYYGSSAFDFIPEFLTRGTDMKLLELAYLYQARRNRDQAPQTTSDELSPVNYLLGAYEKPARALKHLEYYLGTETFDQLMQAYYQKWKFKHPQPKDFQQHLLEANPKLSWFFDGYLYSNQNLDYAISKIKQQEDKLEITLKNKGELAAPFPVAAKLDGKIVQEQWIEGFADKKIIHLPHGTYDEIVIDPHRITLDVNRKNNQLPIKSLFRTTAPIGLQIIPTIENDQRNKLLILPAIAWNNYDKTMLGLTITNLTVPNKRLEFGLMPMYALGSKDFAGVGHLQYSWYLQSELFRKITLGVQGKTFHFDYFPTLDFDLKYARIMPFLKLEFAPPATSRYHHFLQLRTINLHAEAAQFEGGEYVDNDWTNQLIYELRYNGAVRRSINPQEVDLRLEYQDYEVLGESENYLRLSLDYQYGFTFKRGKNFDFRLFTGINLVNSTRNRGAIFPGAFNLSPQGFIRNNSEIGVVGGDYKLDDYYLGRNETSGIWSQQISLREGGFKVPFGNPLALGRSNDYILAINLKTDLPFTLPVNLPLKPYLDLGYFSNAMPIGEDATFDDQFYWSGGLMLDLLDGVAGIYFPLFNKEVIRNVYEERGNYWTRITFSFDLGKANPFDLIHKLEP